MALTFNRSEDGEPLPKRQAALLCLAAAATGWALTLATFYGAVRLLDL